MNKAMIAFISILLVLIIIGIFLCVKMSTANISTLILI